VEPAIDSFGYKKYYVGFIDDSSRFTWIYLIHHKSEVFKFFKEFQCLVERMFNRKIIPMQTDWGGEYERLHSFFRAIDISHHISCPTLTSRMARPNENIGTLSRWDLLC
jgi:hypothetical protein